MKGLDMYIETDIHDGKIIITLCESHHEGETELARGEISIEAIFDEMARITEERRVAHARHMSNPDKYPRPE